MRRLWAGGTVALVCLVVGSAASLAQSSASEDPRLAESDALREDAVALVIAEDPRFADVADWEQLRREAARSFVLYPLVGSDYYRVLATSASELSPAWFDFGYPSNWLIEVTLVRDCLEPSGDTGPWPDPCEWRHSWFYRVAPDRSVTLLFEEGDPEPMPTSDEPAGE